MKTIVFCLFLAAFSMGVKAQQPVHWKYTVKKLAPRKFLVEISARIDQSWHTYSVTTPDGGPVATSISFTKNPIIELEGTPKEIGNLKQVHDDAFDVDVKYFQEEVKYFETVDVKTDGIVMLNGSVKYMACNDKQCLPPTTETFNLSLGEGQ